VDLNSLLYINERTIAEFSEQLGLLGDSSKYNLAAEKRRRAIHQYMWSEEDGMWFDFNLTSREQNRVFYVSSMVSLWAGAFDTQIFTESMAQ
jgi:alpha,alpha-trehalase